MKLIRQALCVSVISYEFIIIYINRKIFKKIKFVSYALENFEENVDGENYPSLKCGSFLSSFNAINLYNTTKLL